MERKLAAILSADAQGYSRLMGDDEAATVHTITEYREVIASTVTRHGGRVVDTPGDNVLVLSFRAWSTPSGAPWRSSGNSSRGTPPCRPPAGCSFASGSTWAT